MQQETFFGSVSVAGGPAPVRVGLDGVPEGYRAMNGREALKVMVRP